MDGVELAARANAEDAPVDVWTLPLSEEHPDRRAQERAARLGDVVRAYGVVTAELDRTCRRCGDPGHGKPRLTGSTDLDLSLAHTGSVLVVAVGRDRTVGVDVESTARLRFDLRAASSVFSVAESGLLAHAEDWRLLSLALWTRKEAVVKAIGAGLAYPLDRVSVASRGKSVFDGDVFELEIEGDAFGVETFCMATGEILSVATTSPWPGVSWCGSDSCAPPGAGLAPER